MWLRLASHSSRAGEGSDLHNIKKSLAPKMLSTSSVTNVFILPTTLSFFIGAEGACFACPLALPLPLAESGVSGLLLSDDDEASLADAGVSGRDTSAVNLTRRLCSNTNWVKIP